MCGVPSNSSIPHYEENKSGESPHTKEEEEKKVLIKYLRPTDVIRSHPLLTIMLLCIPNLF